MAAAGLPDRSRLIDELEHNFWETWSTFGRGPACSLHDEIEMLWYETPIPTIPFNGVLRSQLASDPDRTISSLVRHFEQSKAQFFWMLHPSASPADLGDRLAAHGMEYIEPMAGMARSLDDLPDVPPLPDGMEIRKVGDEHDASAFYQFAAWRWQVPREYQSEHEAITAGFRFGKPGSRAHMWQVWRDGQPVSKAGMYLEPNSAGIYAVVTRPEARKLGLAGILTLTALRYAREHGCPLAVLHSTPMAESLYRSLGFAPVADFRLFASEKVEV